MDTRDGKIYKEEKLPAVALVPNRFMRIEPTPAQMRRRPPRVGRNEPCPCGSGLKFKKCCLQLEQ
jgi:uncharacterized protein YecA (UPF0149 family)